jgi:hypothetical protein
MNWTPGQLADLHAEQQLKQRMRDAGVDPAEPIEREAWEAGYDARSADIERVLDEWYDRYRQGSRIDEDAFLALRNRLIPLAPGEPVQFLPWLRQGDVDPAKRRWLNGTFGGPVNNPDDPQRSGDFWVTATASGRRVPVFLSSVRRRS